MKQTKWLLVVLSMVVFSSGMVFAENEIGFELTTDYSGKYIWRGQNLSDDPVFQPGISATYGNFTAGIWGNLDLTITPSLNYVTLLSDDLRDTDAYGTDSDFFFVGIGLTKKF